VDEKTFYETPITVENRLEQVNPVIKKLFTKDVFLYNKETNDVVIKYSHIRTGVSIAGILMLENNKTFGRTKNKKRLLYKCIPDDKQLPAFLIPYEPTIQFSKVHKNKFIVFKFENWDEQHPHGIIIDTIGDVDNLDLFYEYQLHCKSLHISLIDFTNKTREQLRKKTNEEYIQLIIENPDFSIEDRRHISNIISIDPENSVDFDDAFSITTIDESTYKLTIYIANVYFWLETLNLWKSFSNRVSTIYLPDRKRPMLPTILSDSLCSLQQGVSRFAFALDISIDSNGNIISFEYKNTVINVFKNYSYEEPELVYKNKDYQLLLDITQRLDKGVTDSHDVVAFWMVKMNAITGEYLASNKIGIFRHANFIQPIDTSIESQISSLDISSQRIIKMWNNISGQYVAYNENLSLEHDIMKIKNYIHITSPIRRLVDLLNQLWISLHLGINQNPSIDALEFLDKWIKNMDYLNTSMRSIRKIQTDCEVLHRCFNNPQILKDLHTGTVFDKIQKNDGSYVYMVYLQDLKLLSRFKSYTDIENYSTHQFNIFLFEDEHSLKKKIRVQTI
jgi:exoribonuclease R